LSFKAKGFSFHCKKDKKHCPIAKEELWREKKEEEKITMTK